VKVNRLLSEVIRGVWLLEPSYLLGFGETVHKIVSGQNVEFENSTTALVKIMDPNGNRVRANDDGDMDIPEGSVAVVDMMGAVIKYGDWCTYGADEIVGALQMAENKINIKGSILNIDGPGGAVSAIGPFLQFAKTKTKPVIGLADACMSLHYWTACAVCDYLMADNDVSARFGSVGVVASFQDVKPYYKEQGIVFHEIYPDESANKNEAFRLALEGKYDMIKQEQLSPLAQKFQAGVRAGRPNLKEEPGVLNGKTYDADTSLGLGIIDGIGSLKEAIGMIDKIQLRTELKRII
tara:strand:+ start:261 stop:1142 length:882 start_codon:yes stop_codon:yes gene_type:complete